ncbi:MAG: DUF3604 domain-containing protein [Bacillota bacterium]|nr:DUF3604 domain-containing protein [Bacillota bacterium]
MNQFDERLRPVRIPKDVSISLADPSCARAGSTGSWRLGFKMREPVDGNTELLLLLHGGRNSKGNWKDIQIENPDAPGFIRLSARDSTLLLSPLAGTQNGLFRFQAPACGLTQDEELVLQLGGPAGITAPTFTIKNKFFLIMTVPEPDWEYEEEKKLLKLSNDANNIILFGRTLDAIRGACVLPVVGNDVHHLKAYAPSRAPEGCALTILVRPEDRYGNVSDQYLDMYTLLLDGKELDTTCERVADSTCCQLSCTVSAVGGNPVRLVVFEKETGLSCTVPPIQFVAGDVSAHLLWGMIHAHSEMSDGTGTLDNYFTQMRDECHIDFGATSDHDHLFETTDDMWSQTCAVTKSYNEPGRFTTFLGYEWAKWAPNGYGDRNVYYLEDDRPMYRSDPGCYPEPKDLFAALQDEKAMVIPHHTATRENPCDWKQHDPEKERLVEIFSVWGNSERSIKHGNPFPVKGASKKPLLEGYGNNEAPEGFVQQALALGWKVGFTSGGDDHIGHAGDCSLSTGILAVYAAANTRPAIWQALWDRHCYATTGARLVLDFALNHHPMGSILKLEHHPDLKAERMIQVTVQGTSPVTCVEVVRNNVDIYRHEFDALDVSFIWIDRDELDAVNLMPALHNPIPFTFYYIRVMQADGEMAWSSPIWVE